VIDAVILDLDGLLIDSEQVWDDVRERYTRESGGTYTDTATRDMMGMSSLEWSRYMHEVVGLPESPEEINREVVGRLLERYAAGPPWLPGAVDAVRRLAGAFVLGLASSSNRELIDRVLEAGGIADCFRATASSEEVAAGKPAPDVYLEVARRLDTAPPECAAVEDSHNGIRSAKAAGMRCVAIPNAHFPPGEAVEEADAVVRSLDELTPEFLVA
jgi:HAD superfamily hydrolase (TIGR01509 family)